MGMTDAGDPVPLPLLPTHICKEQQLQPKKAESSSLDREPNLGKGRKMAPKSRAVVTAEPVKAGEKVSSKD